MRGKLFNERRQRLDTAEIEPSHSAARHDAGTTVALERTVLG
jgi:hypothetical protein